MPEKRKSFKLAKLMEKCPKTQTLHLSTGTISIKIVDAEPNLVLGNEAKRVGAEECHGLQQKNELSKLPNQREEEC